MDGGIIENKKIENLNKIPLKERMAFQRLLIQQMLNEEKIDKTDERWNIRGGELAETYGKIISDIIDDPKNKEIRDLIMKKGEEGGGYEEASILINEMLKTKKVAA